MDDLYDGFGDEEDFSAFGGGGRFGAAPGMSLGRGPPSTSHRLMTSGGSNNIEFRPVTSNQGAGYTSDKSAGGGFDPLNQGVRAASLEEKSEKTPEERAREIERQVHNLLEQSAIHASKKQMMPALEKAKEAVKRERSLCKHKESQKLGDQISLELTYAVNFNLANSYALNCMFNESLNLYQLIVKNKQYQQPGRLRVNMGNIYFIQSDFVKAIRMYRMALDQIPNTGKEMRFRIMRNIGNALVRLGQFQEAITNYEAVMLGNPDFQTGFNLIVCYYALGDTEQMKKGFQRLLEIPIQKEEEDEDEIQNDEEDKDCLTQELMEREKRARKYILDAAKLISPAIDKKNWVAGYEWVIQELEEVQPHIASEMEIGKSIEYLKDKKFDKAIEVLKAFEKKDQHLKAKAATNLSFLYFLEGDLAAANKYANLAVRHDRYNAKALVNKGNCLFVQGEFERAKELFLEAIGVEADCSEAIFNLGLVNQRMGLLEESLQAFEKLHTIVPNSPEVIYQIANLHDLVGNFEGSTKWFNILVTRVPTDPHILSRLGQVFNKEDDETQALHYHHESYRYYPVNLDVISWLGVWYVKSELYEKAIEFFQRASQIQPNEVKWRLMVTSCYRRMSAYQKALSLYEEIHKDYPENVECLRYLVAICKDMGLQYGTYQTKLAKLDDYKAIPMETRREESFDEDERKADPIKNIIAHSMGDRGPIIKSSHEADEWADADIDDLLAE